MRRRASVFSRRGRFFVHADSQAVSGVWVSTAPFETLDDTASPEALGALVLRALDASRTGIPHPAPDADIFRPMLSLAGVKTFGVFMRDAAHVEVGEEGGQVTLTPYRNEGRRGGFTPLDDKEETLTQPSARELGEAIIEALAKAE